MAEVRRSIGSEVVDRFPHKFGIVSEHSEAGVAQVTEQRSRTSASVAVVNDQSALGGRLGADSTDPTLIVEHPPVVGGVDIMPPPASSDSERMAQPTPPADSTRHRSVPTEVAQGLKRATCSANLFASLSKVSNSARNLLDLEASPATVGEPSGVSAMLPKLRDVLAHLASRTEFRVVGVSENSTIKVAGANRAVALLISSLASTFALNRGKVLLAHGLPPWVMPRDAPTSPGLLHVFNLNYNERVMLYR